MYDLARPVRKHTNDRCTMQFQRNIRISTSQKKKTWLVVDCQIQMFWVGKGLPVPNCLCTQVKWIISSFSNKSLNIFKVKPNKHFQWCICLPCNSSQASQWRPRLLGGIISVPDVQHQWVRRHLQWPAGGAMPRFGPSLRNLQQQAPLAALWTHGPWVHTPQMEEGWRSLLERWEQKEAVKNKGAWEWENEVMIHCGSCKYEWKPERGSKHIILDCGQILYIGCVLLWSLSCGRPAECSFELQLRPLIKNTPSLWSLLKNTLLPTCCLLPLHPIAEAIDTSLKPSTSIFSSSTLQLAHMNNPYSSSPLNIQNLFTLLRSFKIRVSPTLPLSGGVPAILIGIKLSSN